MGSPPARDGAGSGRVDHGNDASAVIHAGRDASAKPPCGTRMKSSRQGAKGAKSRPVPTVILASLRLCVRSAQAFSRQRAVFGVISLALLVILALARCAPHAVSALAFEGALRPLYGVAFASRERLFAPCASWNAGYLSRLTEGQRSAVGSLLNALT